MPRVWPDPRDEDPDSPAWLWIVGGALGLAMLGNLGAALASLL